MGGKSAEILATLESALASGLAPIKIPKDTQRVTVRVPSMLMAELDRSRHGKPVGVFASGLIAAWHGRGSLADRGDDLDGFRDDQRRLAIQIDRNLVQGAYVLAEGSTGIGKGLINGRLAGRSLDLTIVASPTIKVLSQNLAEYAKLRKKYGYPQARLFIGRRHFISVGRLTRAIEEILWQEEHLSELVVDLEEHKALFIAAQAAKRWIDGGGYASAKTDGRTAALREILPTGRFLTADLRECAPGFPVDEVVLEPNEDSEDPGQQAYAAMRDSLRSNAVGPIFTTHYALILSNRFLKGSADADNEDESEHDARSLLPTPHLLIVDEAHQLAGAAERVFTKTIALSTLVKRLAAREPWHSLRLESRAKETSAAIAQIAEKMIDVFEISQEYGIGNTRASLRPLAQQLLRRINELTARRKIPHTPDTEILFEAREIAKQIASTNADYSVRLDASPVYRYPSLSVGPNNLFGFFKKMWDTIDQAVFISATIYVPRSTTSPSSPLITTLHIDPVRTKMIPAVIARWLYEGVTLTTAHDEPDLHPPAVKDPNYVNNLARWHERIAVRIKNVWETARGGTIVLLTSYDSIEALAKLLDPTGQNPALIVQRRGRFDAAESAFRVAYKNGDKPLWLAGAQAWTGMDIRDTNAVDISKDFLLTDLVIPRIPLGTEQSRIHQKRYERNRYIEWDRAAMQFRQGIGRLIRAEGMRERRLHVLDGRIWNPKKTAMVEPYLLMLAPYRRSL